MQWNEPSAPLDLLASNTVWSERGLVVTLRDSENRVVPTQLDRPFARIGAHPESDVVLRAASMPPRALYLHGTNDGIYCMSLEPALPGRAFPNGWLRPKIHARVGPYRINAAFADAGPSPRFTQDDPRLPGSAGDNAPLLRFEAQDGPYQVIEQPLRRRLTLVGSRAPSKILLDHPSITPAHCILAWDGESLWVVDLLSDGGTQLDGATIDQARVPPGSTLTLGKIQVTYIPGRAAGAVPRISDSDAFRAFAPLFAPSASAVPPPPGVAIIMPIPTELTPPPADSSERDRWQGLLKSLRNDVARGKDREQELLAQARQWQATSDIAVLARQSSQQELERSQADQARLREQMSALAQELATAITQSTQTAVDTSQVSLVDAELADFRNEALASTATRAALELQVGQGKQALLQAEKLLEHRKGELETLRQQAAGERQAERARQGEETNRWAEERQTLAQELAQLRARCEQAEAQAAAVATSEAQIRQRLAEVESKSGQATGQRAVLVKDHAALQEAHRRLAAEHDKLRDKLTSLVAQREPIDKELRSVRQEREAFRTQLNQSQAQHSQVERELKALREDAHLRERQSAVQAEALANAQQDLARTLQDLASTRRDLEEAQQFQEAAQIECQAALDELRAAREREVSLTTSLATVSRLPATRLVPGGMPQALLNNADGSPELQQERREFKRLLAEASRNEAEALRRSENLETLLAGVREKCRWYEAALRAKQLPNRPERAEIVRGNARPKAAPASAADHGTEMADNSDPARRKEAT